MPQTFEAILRGDRLEWVGDAPPEGEVRVHVTVPDPFPRWTVPDPDRPGGFLTPEAALLTPEERGRKMGEILATLAASRTEEEWDEFKREWLESRKDRVFPGREDA